MSEAKGGMSFEEAKQRRGKKMVYLKAPWLNVIVADKYKDDTSYAWVELAKFFVTLTGQPKATKVAVIHEGTMYYWMSYNLIISRLWHYGIRSKSTVSRALYLLCNPSNNQPPILKRIEKRDRNGHLRLYYTGTDALDDLFSTDPEWADHSEDAYDSSNEDDVFDDEASEEPPKSETHTEDFVFPKWWNDYFEKIQSFNKYGDNLYKRGKGTLNKHIIESVRYINALLDGTFYDEIGADLTDKYDLSGMTLDRIIKGLDDCWVKEGSNPYVKDVIKPFSVKGTARSSPLLDTIFGTRFQKPLAKPKPKKLPEADPPKDPPKWLWDKPHLPSLYPDITPDDRHFWAFYLAAVEYAEDCQIKKGDDRSKWGMWPRQNNGVTTSPNNFLLDIFRAAKKAGMGVEEIYSLKFGDVNNFLWILTAREMKQNHSIKILPEGSNNEYVYGTGPLNRAKYERRN